MEQCELIVTGREGCWTYSINVFTQLGCTGFLPNIQFIRFSIVRSMGFGSFISIEVCRDCILALAPSSKKQLMGFFVCLLFFLKVKHIS